MRFLTLAEALTIAEAVTGTPSAALARGSRLDLLDSALHAPRAGFGDVDFHPDFTDKAAVLVVRIAKNHSLPDGNKRLAWQSLTMFCVLNGFALSVPTEEAVELMLAIAAGDLDETSVAAWLEERLQPRDNDAQPYRPPPGPKPP